MFGCGHLAFRMTEIQALNLQVSEYNIQEAGSQMRQRQTSSDRGEKA